MANQSRQALAAASLLIMLLASACAPGNVSASGPNTPGWTGSTVIIGNNSTIAGDATATENQQKWPLGRGR